MKVRLPSRRLFLVISLVVATSLALFDLWMTDNKGGELPQSVVFENKGLGPPVRLRIPSIDVDAGVEYVGLTLSGEMGAPKSPENVAWLNLGPNPGEVGSVVIAGHSGWENAIPAVFDNLDKLDIGDKLYIENNKGTTVVFIVRKIQSYDSGVDTSIVFSSTDEKEHLNLITCAGDWDKIAKKSASRLVVFTDKE